MTPFKHDSSSIIHYPVRIFLQPCSRRFFLLSNNYNESFSDSGAHQDFQMPEFFLPAMANYIGIVDRELKR